MSGPQFFETGMGRKFYEGTVPRLARAVEKVAKELETMNRYIQEAKELDEATKEDEDDLRSTTGSD